MVEGIKHPWPRLQASSHAVQHGLVLQARDPAEVVGASRPQSTREARRSVAVVDFHQIPRLTLILVSEPLANPRQIGTQSYYRTCRATGVLRRHSASRIAGQAPGLVWQWFDDAAAAGRGQGFPVHAGMDPAAWLGSPAAGQLPRRGGDGLLVTSCRWPIRTAPHPQQDKLGHQRAYTYDRMKVGVDESNRLYGYTHVGV